MPDVKDDIQKLQKEAAAQLAEAERLAKLSEAFPDIKKYTGRWNKVAYYSPTVNEKITDYDMRHNCGCCNDSPLEIWPFAETPVGKVYSDPPVFVVGERHYYHGDKPYAGWRKKLVDAHIPEAIIEKIAYHFQYDKEQRIALASEDAEELSEENINE